MGQSGVLHSGCVNYIIIPNLQARCEATLVDILSRAMSRDTRLDALEAFAREIRRETLEQVRKQYRKCAYAWELKQWLDAQLQEEP